MRRVSVVGLGKLGLGFAAAAATRGFEVIGVDINEAVVASVNKREAPIHEPGLQEAVSTAGSRLRATKEYGPAINECDLSFILVATPSDAHGYFSNKNVESVLESLAVEFGASTKSYHVFVISSTLMPTSTETRLIPLIEQHSGRRLGVDFGVCYVPDFVALGRVIEDFLNPDIIVIGESDRKAGDWVQRFFGKFCENSPPLARMSIISAEITKVSLNAYIAMKISFANMLGNICAKIEGSDVDAITNALGADRRISPHYLRAAIAYGGSCFPRDTRAFIGFAEKVGVPADMIETVEQVNEQQNLYLLEVVIRELEASGTSKVSVLGIAFKPDTPVISASAGCILVEGLLGHDLEVMVYDPLAIENAKAQFGDDILYASSIGHCIAHAPVVVITTPDKRFGGEYQALHEHPPASVIDCWRILDPRKIPASTRYVGIGVPGAA